MKKLTIVKAEVGKELEIISIENTLDAIRHIIGGYMEVVRITDDILLVVNEEGMLMDLPVNFQVVKNHNGSLFREHVIHGNVFFVSTLGEDFHSLDKIQIQQVKRMFEASREICFR